VTYLVLGAGMALVDRAASIESVARMARCHGMG
jgi:hypothetical protein